MKSKPYCYFHMKLKRMDSQPMIHIPMLEDSTSVLLGIGQVMRMLALDTMEIKRAGIMLYGLQIATCVIKQRAQAKPEEYVRSVHDEAGNDVDLSQAMIRETPALAPENIVCEPPHDCAQCEQKTNCEKRRAALDGGTHATGQNRTQDKPEKPGAPSKPMPDTSCPNTLTAAWVGNIEPSPHSRRTKRTSQTGDLALSHPAHTIDTTPSPHTLRKIAPASLQ